MRKLLQRRHRSGTTRTPRRIALFVALCAVLATSVSFGAIASARISTPNDSVSGSGGSSTYGGGRLMASDPLGGYWTTSWSGDVTSYGGASTFGSPALSGLHLQKPIIGMAATPDGQGYWLVASDGGVFTYGDAPFYGSTGSLPLNQPIVGMAVTPDGLGYWLVASDGGIFTFGDASFHGSTGSLPLNQPIVGMAVTPDGQGYWLVASDGGIFTFGDAIFYGSTGAMQLNKPVIGMTATPDGSGYWLVASDGGIFTYGDATFYGSLGGGAVSALGMVVDPTVRGYKLVEDGGAAASFPRSEAAASSPSIVAVAPPVISAPTPPVAPATPDASQGSDCQPTTLPTASADSSLDSVVSGQAGPGWIGGDATYSTQLPNGQEAFVFSDTLIGTAQASGQAALSGFIHNSELTGSLPALSGDFGGTSNAPQTLIQDTLDPGDQWQVAATYVEHGNQLVYVNEFAPVPGSFFDHYNGRSGIAVMSLSAGGAPTLGSVTLIPTDLNTQWGNAAMQAGGFTYVYGSDIDPSSLAFYGMKVARVPVGESLNTNDWQYWNGAAWVSGEVNAVPVATPEVLTGVTVQQSGNGYIAVSVPGGVYDDKTVDLSYACSPIGPWSAPTPIYAIPQVAQYHDEIAYMPTFHPELSSQGGLVISYNLDTTDGLPALEQDVHEYQPQFLQLSGGA
jgi:hypothetical protein